MRCLYCGKELALLKRWTGGGEFCSDAHRQKYQEEYNKLALNRLLQAQQPESKAPAAQTPAAKPQPEARPAAKPAPKPAPVKTPVVEPVAAKVPAEPPKPAPKKYEEPVPQPMVAVAVEPVAEESTVVAEPEEEIPAESTDFLLELPVPVTVEAKAISQPDCEFRNTSSPVLPEPPNEAWSTELVAAGQVVLEPSGRVLDSVAAPVERKLELREFVRAAPVAGFELRPAGETGLLEISEEPMEILIFPHPPQGSPPLWQEAEQNFRFETDLDSLARVPFGTTGLEDNREDSGVPSAAPKLEPIAQAPEAPVQAKPAVVQPAPKPVAAQPAPVAKPEVKPEPKPEPRPEPKLEPKPEPRIEPRFEPRVVSKPLFARPPLAKPADPPAPVAAKAAPGKKPDPVPGVATKPLPLTLHGLAAGRGKPVQVFASAVSAGVDVQIPRSNALPMRPVMVVATAAPKVEEKKPADRTVVVKSDPKPAQPARPDSRFSNGKGRKPDVRITEPSPERREEKIAAPAAAVKERAPEPLVEKKPAAEVKPLPVKPAPAAEPAPSRESKLRPLSAPYTAPDLGLPNLSLETSGGFFSRLPMTAKAGAAVLLVAGIIGIAMLGKNKSPSAGAGQVVEVGSPLPVVDSGWITDWGAEPGVRKVHEISILRPSLNLSDYRLEFEAQIDTKALGWVYRAKDGKNYYVNRLEIVKPGLDPTVAVVRFAVINGEEQPRSQFPLNLPVHLDTLYKIRFDAVGDHFTTYVQGKKVDEWTDSQIKVGGVGLYNERGERMSLKGGVSVVPLAIRR